VSPRMGNGVALPIGEVMVFERAWSLDEEILTPRFVVQEYPFAAFLKCTLQYDDNSSNPLF
jgi:hypothetical protein